MLAGHLALVAASVFTGAAFYINYAEQPARLGLDDRSLLAEWKLAYQRGYVMQASLAIVGFLLGLPAWWITGTAAFLVGALLMVANWPWTLLGVLPTNKALMAMDLTKASVDTRALLLKWNRLHAVRTALGGLAVASFVLGVNSS
jgi:Anthrone oxygenase